jgi:hypothetical protein
MRSNSMTVAKAGFAALLLAVAPLAYGDAPVPPSAPVTDVY